VCRPDERPEDCWSGARRSQTRLVVGTAALSSGHSSNVARQTIWKRPPTAAPID